VSPILVRPVREQLEHDRIIRLLPARYKRRFEVGINPGGEQNAPVGAGPAAVFPDAVLYSAEKSRKILGVVEVETIESINHLEAMAEWAVYGRLKVPFHLYVPVAALDVARRLASDNHATVAEIWSFDNVGDQVRFTLVHKDPASEVATPAPRAAAPKAVKVTAKAAPAPKPVKPVAKPKPAPKVAKPSAKPAKPTRPAKAAKAVKPAAKARPTAPARKAAPARTPPRPAAKAAPKRAPAGRATAARKGSGAQKRK
jgi:hypothetical protein